MQSKLEQHTDEIAGRFRWTLQERPEVMACHAMIGDMDFLLHVVVLDTIKRSVRVPVGDPA